MLDKLGPKVATSFLLCLHDFPKPNHNREGNYFTLFILLINDLDKENGRMFFFVSPLPSIPEIQVSPFHFLYLRQGL